MQELIYHACVFLSEHLVLQLFLMYVLPFFVFFAIVSSPFKTRIGEFFATVTVLAYILFILLSLSAKYLMPSDYVPPDRANSVSTMNSGIDSSASITDPDPIDAYDPEIYWATYYSIFYPKTWAFIDKYADDPFEYAYFYHTHWGELQEQRGDGIPFNTLTPQEMALVNYPPIGDFIYVVKPTSDTYHSTEDCYTLLRSGDLITLRSWYRTQYEPCSKCVGE